MTLFTVRQLLSCSLLALSASSISSAQGSPARLGSPEILTVASGMPTAQRSMLTRTARTFYAFWTTDDEAAGKSVISATFTDHDLPEGRPQGPTGPLFANTQFHKAVPDLHCQVLQQIVAGDRVVSNLRFTGHFTGTFGSTQGSGQSVDFVATDILRIEAGKITDNWHIEDNLTFQKQIGVVK